MQYTVYFFGDNSQYRIFLIITQFKHHLLKITQVLNKFPAFLLFRQETL